MINRVFGILSVLLLIMFSGACSIPGAEKAAAADSAGDLLSRALAQHPTANITKIIDGDFGYQPHMAPSVAWSGKEYGVCWSGRFCEIYFVRVNANGVKIGAINRISDDSKDYYEPVLAMVPIM
jgi:hypothetical protein